MGQVGVILVQELRPLDNQRVSGAPPRSGPSNLTPHGLRRYARPMEHEVAVASLTGGMAPTPAPFVGSDRLHPDGRPKDAFRDSLRTVPDARKIPAISYEEMLELASLGAKMHPRSIELGLVYKMPILVASSFNDVPGTIITEGENKLNNKNVGEVRNRVRGIATDENISRITIGGLDNVPGTATKIFEPLSIADISVDVIVQNSGNDGQTNISFTVKDNELNTTKTIMEQVCANIDNSSFTYDSGLSKISIVGTGMQDAPGYATQMFKSLSDANINIEMITTSEIRITCIIKQENTKQAARILHSSFDLDSPNC